MKFKDTFNEMKNGKNNTNEIVNPFNNNTIKVYASANNNWEETTSNNCTLLEGRPLFTFDIAIDYLNNGYKLRRDVWDPDKYIASMLFKNIYATLASQYNITKDISSDRSSYYVICDKNSYKLWSFNKEDILANNWTFVK